MNLGLKQTNTEVVAIELSDVLSAELEFNQAYQSFVDYRNTCEIVKGAQASAERMSFANELLGISIESIDVSVEKLSTVFAAALDKFIAWIKQAISYIKYTVLKHSFKKDGEFSIPVVYSSEIISKLNTIYEKIVSAIRDKNIAELNSLQKEVSKISSNKSTEDTLTTRAAVVEFIRTVETHIYWLSRLRKLVGKLSGEASANQYTIIINTLKNDVQTVLAAAKKESKKDK